MILLKQIRTNMSNFFTTLNVNPMITRFSDESVVIFEQLGSVD